MLSDDSGLMFPKPKHKRKKKKHKKNILKTEKHTCYLCSNLYNDWSYKYTEEHHILFGSGQRQNAEAEGIKVYLCCKHHREGPEAVHNNKEMEELLCRTAQREYEKKHTREEWMQISKKNYLSEREEESLTLAAGDYVQYIGRNCQAKEGYILNIIGFCDENIVWIGRYPNSMNQKIEFVDMQDIIGKVPPP